RPVQLRYSRGVHRVARVGQTPPRVTTATIRVLGPVEVVGGDGPVALPAKARIVTGGGSYALEAPPELVDAMAFQRLVEESAAARRDGNPALALSLAAQAARLWRGGAYSDLASLDFLHPESERLEELRLVALEERLDALLELGRHADALAETLRLASENPLRERLQRQAMLTLYRSGRQSEALEHFAALRRRLDDELGLAPSADVRELQRRILQQ